MRAHFNGWGDLSRDERVKAALLSGWFFLVTTILWLLKPIRSSSLLAHLGSEEIPYVRLGSVVAVAGFVALYSRLVDRLSRVQVAGSVSLAFAAILMAFWLALRVGAETLGAQRWFVWSVFILVDLYSTVMIGIFWTYTNDVVSRAEADRLYGPIGIGGIVGGIAGGAIIDTLVDEIGPVDVLLVCVGLVVVSAVLAARIERVLRPVPRRPIVDRRLGALATMLAGARAAVRTPYLLLIAGIVVGYEFAAAMTDFVVNVVFERHIEGQTALAQMFGRLGWIVSATALVSQLVLVPWVLPLKRAALLVPPIAMAVGTLGLVLVPAVWMAVVLSASDRGLNYSLQQSTKETLYVAGSDVEKYKAKAFIDMFVDRLGKALSALALILVIALAGLSVTISLAVALGALAAWGVCAEALGRAYERRVAATWEHFEHGADVGIRGRGATVERAFEQAALALTAVAAEPRCVEPREPIEIECQAPDLELLLFDFLNALVLESSVRSMLFSRLEVHIVGLRLRATAWGEHIDVARHCPRVEVKGATMTELRVRQEGAAWVAQCVVDV